MKSLMKSFDDFNNETLEDTEQEEIARLITEGCTSGRLDSGDGKSILWELHTNSWQED